MIALVKTLIGLPSTWRPRLSVKDPLVAFRIWKICCWSWAIRWFDAASAHVSGLVALLDRAPTKTTTYVLPVCETETLCARVGPPINGMSARIDSTSAALAKAEIGLETSTMNGAMVPNEYWSW